MKRNLIILLLLLVGGWVVAQEKDSVKMLEPVTVTPSSNVNTEVTKVFNKTFKNAVHPKWYEVDKDYLVKFIQNDMNNNVYFKENGKMVYHISYGYEKNLTPDMIQMVRDAYPDFKISRAIHVQAKGRNLWVLNLESATRWVMAGIEEGQLQELDNFRKG